MQLSQIISNRQIFYFKRKTHFKASFCVCSRYRKVVANNCTKGVKEMYSARKQQCPNRPPRGLVLTTRDDKLTANLGSNVTFLLRLEEVRSESEKLQPDANGNDQIHWSDNIKCSMARSYNYGPGIESRPKLCSSNY